MTRINELVNFEEIKDVIDIDSDLETKSGKENIVGNYVISEGLKPHLLNLAENLSQPEHKSYQIIGGYGSGKSHLLGWMVSILENQDLIEKISDKEVRGKFSQEISRNFAVVQFELQPGNPQLSDFFLDRLEKQLKEKYDIDIPTLDTSKAPDYKKYIKDVVEVIKKDEQTRGLVVVIDEISDFLKQKKKQASERDNQFLRILGQVSKNTDFLFVGSMQENVFTNPKYIDDAESYGRVAGRFNTVTISQEDIKKVIAKRVLGKSQTQQEELRDILDEYANSLTDDHSLKSNPGEFINLFPVHPYVIELFNELEYFEKRGAIQFVTKEVEKILDEEFPSFVTFDKIYDAIYSDHNKRNLDDIRPVVEVVNTLKGKVDLLEERYQEDAKKLIKALAVLKIHGGDDRRGAIPEELADKLLITSETISSEDRVQAILDKLREATSGQFLSKKDNYYFIDLESDIDFDEVIKRKVKNLKQGVEDDELLQLLGHSDLVDFENSERYQRKFLDSCNWPTKKSFKKGHFIFDDGAESVEKGDLDYNLVVVSPYLGESDIRSSSDTAILKLEYNEELDEALKKLAATNSLIQENYRKTVMKGKRQEFLDAVKKKLLQLLINSKIEVDGDNKKVQALIRQEPDSIDEFFHHLKQRIFDDIFNETYPKYPKMLNQLSPENIMGEVETAINDLVSSEKNFVSNTKNLLSALDLIDVNGNIDTSDSLFAKVIIDELEDKKGKNVKIENLIEKLKQEPFGLQEELSKLIIIVLTYNGEVKLKKKGGSVVTSSDLENIFDKGLASFNVLRYATLETEFPIEDTIRLFRIFDLNEGLVRSKKDRSKAVQEFRSKILEVKNELETLKRNVEEICNKPEPVLDKEQLKEQLSKLDDLPMEDLSSVKSVNDFKNVQYNENEVKQIENLLKLLEGLKGLIKDYNESIYNNYSYMKNGIEHLTEHQRFFPEGEREELQEIRVKCKNVVNDFDKLVDHEERRVLIGKLEKFKRKYINTYYNSHSSTVGKDVDWNELEILSNSEDIQRLRNIKAVKCINPLKLRKLENRIVSLSKARCLKLEKDHLKESYICRWCKFPKNLEEVKDVDQAIEEIRDQIEKIEKEWEKTILNEVESYEDNIELLSPDQKDIVKSIREKGSLPDDINQKVINTLNELFSELEETEIQPDEIEEFVFSDNNVLNFETFSEKLDEFKNKIAEEKEKKHIRIKKTEE